MPAEEELGHQHIANPSEIIPWDWSCASLRTGGWQSLGCGDGQELPQRVVPGRKIPVKDSTCDTGMPSAGAMVETLRCLNCEVVREAGSQGLV